MTIPLRCVVDTSVCIKQFISDPLTSKVNQLFDHLLAYGISAYDACYVALSQQVSAMLLTLDQRLVRSIAAAYDVRSFNDFSVPPLP